MNMLEQDAFKELYGIYGSQGMPQGHSKSDLAKGRIGEESEEKSERPRSLLLRRRRAHLRSSDDGFWNAETLTTLFLAGGEQLSYPSASVQEESGPYPPIEFVWIHESQKKYGRMRVRTGPPAIMTVGSLAHLVTTTPFHKLPDLDMGTDLAWSEFIDPPDSPDSAEPVHPVETVASSVRAIGPVQFILKLLKTWNLKTEHAAILLGLEDQEHVRQILAGLEPLTGRDVKDRIAHLYHIRRTLWSLFRDAGIENEWLREPHSLIHDMTPIDLLLDGSMESLLTFKEYVEALARR